MGLWTFDGTAWQTLPLHRKSAIGCAVICCNGPSFAGVDASKLRGPNRCVIGVNSTYPRLRPDWWVGMDTHGNHDRALFYEAFPKVLRGGHHNTDKIEDRLVREFPNCNFLDLRETGHWSEVMQDQFVNWNKNSFEAAFQFALWLGYRDIALVGVDLDNSKHHYADGNYLSDKNQKSNQRLYDAQLKFLKEVMESAASLGISLISCSEGSRINEFVPCRPVAELYGWCAEVAGRGRDKLHVREEWFDREDRKYSTLYRDRNYPIGPVMEVVKAFNYLRDEKTVDLGCGRGALSEYFVDYTGVDVSRWVVDDCRRRLARTFHHSSLHDLECLRGQEFDLAICSDVMEHIPPDKVDDVLAEIACVKAKRFAFSIATHEAKWKDEQGENLHLSVWSALAWTELMRKHFSFGETDVHATASSLLVECRSKVLQTG